MASGFDSGCFDEGFNEGGTDHLTEAEWLDFDFTFEEPEVLLLDAEYRTSSIVSTSTTGKQYLQSNCTY